MSTGIKACPCCGERIPVTQEGVVSAWGTLHIVVCREDHGGCGTSTGRHNTRRDAARAWNRRAIGAVIKQALDALQYHVEQTRPIERTTAAIAALRAAQGESKGGGK